MNVRHYRSHSPGMAVALRAVIGCAAIFAYGTGISAAAEEETTVSVPVAPYVAPPNLPTDEPPVARDPFPEGGPEPAGPIPEPEPVDDGITQIEEEPEPGPQLPDFAPPDALSAPDVNVPGVTANAFPPDTVLDVGPNHVVQMANNSGYVVYDKRGNPIPAGTPNNAIRLMSALWPAGNVCAQDDTDPIVVYDHLANRWLIAQVIRDPGAPGGGAFIPPGPALCIAVSQTPDPTGLWFAYTFGPATLPGGIFPDYEKIGVWPDGYYMSSYEGSNLGIWVFNRTNMLAGVAANFMKTTISSLSGNPGVRDTRILPVDLDGPPPAAGTPNFFVRPVDDQQDIGDPTDRIEVWTAATNWGVPSLTFTLVDTLTPAAFQVMVCNRNGGGTRDCIPQPGTANTVDALSNRPMMQAKFRNFNGDWRIVFNQTINVAGGIFGVNPPPANEVAGIRWYELQNGGAGWGIRQEGTYAPQPIFADAENELNHRWMGSMAMDGQGSMALGYNIVNTDPAAPLPPSISYAGRESGDLLGQLTQIEQSILVGTNTEGFVGARWGDYSAMSVDPVDDCTFWYTTHVATGGGGKPTQIASFGFDYCAADLSVTKTDSPDPVIAGQQLTYTVTVANAGPLDATNVTVVDTLPAGVTYQTDTDSCVEAPAGTLTCDLGDINAGDSDSFDIVVLVDSDLTELTGPTSIANTAVGSQDQADDDPSNNTATATTIVNELADLFVQKSCKPDTFIASGGTATCFIDVTNLGPSSARDVSLTDTHFANGGFAFTVTDATTDPAGGTCNIAAGVVTCDLGDIAAGATVTVAVELTSDAEGDVNDSATATSPTPDPNLNNNTATGAVHFRAAADLALTKTDTPDPVIAGQNLTYDFSITNNGPSTAVNVVVTDLLSASLSVVSITSSGGTCNAGTPGSVASTCTFDSMAAAAVETMQIVTRVNASVPDGTILFNNAQVSSDTADSNNANDLATTATTVNGSADLSIDKSDSPDPVVAGSNLTYTMRVSNAGPSVATSVQVSDTLPLEVDFLSAVISHGSGTCEALAGSPTVVNCSVGTIAVGDYVDVIIQVQVKADTPEDTELLNSATVSSATDDPNEANNTDTETTTVTLGAEIWLDKTGVEITGNPSRTIRYTLTVNNLAGCEADDQLSCGAGGPSDAEDVVVVDTLPLTAKKLKVVFVSENCLYNKVTHKVTCTLLQDLPFGASASFIIDVQPVGSIGDITNSATVTSSTADPVPGNNTDLLKMTVKGGSSKPSK